LTDHKTISTIPITVHIKKQLLTILLSLGLPALVSAQNIFRQKVEGCNTAQFCLDCGEPKADIDAASLDAVIKSIGESFKISKSGKGGVIFQVLVDSVGQPCVLSHTDATNSLMTRGLIGYLNAAKFTPAIEKGKAVMSSINVGFFLADGKITGQVQRVDQDAFSRGFKSAGEPKIFNKTYQYQNANLNSYQFTSWNKSNSGLLSDLSQHCVVSKDGDLWYATVLDGITLFDGFKFLVPEKGTFPFAKGASINAMVKDKDDNIWVADASAIYKYANNKWEKFDSLRIGIDGAYRIIPNPDGSIFFAADNGLLELKEDKWTMLNKDKITQLPSNRVYDAYRDKRGRVWIGTFSGSIMVDENGKITDFNQTQTPVKNTCISDITEDDNGNIYFALYAYGKHGEDLDEEGLAVYTANGEWLHYNDKNSGMPANHINSMFYDMAEKLLWISTNRAGLVRYNLKDGWENYHNKNSDVPSYDVYQVAAGKNGVLYVSTYNGLLRIAKK